jgi:hypothetical protein
MPAAAEFCMKCGVRSAVGQPPRSVSVPPLAKPAGPDKGKIALGVLAVLALAAAGYLGWRAFSKPNRVVQVAGQRPNLGPLTERSGRLTPPAPLTDQTGTVPAAEPEPTDIIDYLKFLKDIERQRVLLAKTQMGEVLKQSGDLTYAGASADWTTDEPEKRYKEVYGRFQQSLSLWSGQWQELAGRFLAYPKPVPAACGELRDRYYALLSATSTGMSQIGNSFAQALSGDPGKALDALTRMQGSGLGSSSKDIGDACVAADDSLAAVCDKFKLRKDFQIRDDLGGGNLLGR